MIQQKNLGSAAGNSDSGSGSDEKKREMTVSKRASGESDERKGDGNRNGWFNRRERMYTDILVRNVTLSLLEIFN